MMWVVSTNTNDCHIYSYDKKLKSLKLVKDINHPENKLKASETLTSDRPGHYQAGGEARGAYSPHTDPKTVEINAFASEIAHALNKGRNENAYNDIMIITPPTMSGLISLHLDKHVKEKVLHTIHKDVHQLNERELIEFIEKNS